MKKIIGILCTAVLVASLMLQPAFAFAAEPAAPSFTKSETVYVRLSPDATTKGIYVVNSFESTKAQTLTDFGPFESVTNLSTSQELVLDSGEVRFEAPEGIFYYQGNMAPSTELPWSISLSYTLDGRVVTPEALAGASGKLEIMMNIAPNENDEALAPFTENYLLQASTSLASDVASNVQAEGATIAEAGSAKSLNFMVIPGTSGEFVIRADVVDFEYEGFQIAAVPFSFAFDLDEADLDTMTESMAELQDAIAALSDGSGEIADASALIKSGLNTLASEGSSLADGSAIISDSLGILARGMSGAQAGSQEFLDEIDGAMAAITNQLAPYPVDPGAAQSALETATSGFEQVVQGSNDGTTGLTTILGLYEAGSITADEALAQIKTAVEQAGVAWSSFEAAGLGLQEAQQYVDAVNLYMILAQFRTGYVQLNDGFAQLNGGLYLLDNQYGTFDGGVNAYVGGVGTLASNYATFDAGLAELASGASLLRDGTINLDQELLDGIEDQVAGMTGGNFTPLSFTSAQNTNIEQVQFIFMIDGVEIPEEETVEEEAEEEKTVLQRLLDLFVPQD